MPINLLRKLLWFTVFGIVLLHPFAAAAHNYYIDPVSGNDNWDGFYPEYINGSNGPWKTLLSLKYKSFSQADTIYLRGGTYLNDRIEAPGGSGFSLVNYQNEVPVITGTNFGSGWPVIYLNASNINVTLRGIHIENASVDAAGAIWLVNAHHTTIEDCVLFNINTSAIVGNLSNNLTIRGCTITKIGDHNDENGWGVGDAIYFNGCDFSLVENNTFKECGHAAFDLQWYGDANTSSDYNSVRNNFIDQGWGGGIYVNQQSSYNLIEGNTITRIGEQMTYPKSAISVTGDHNTVRKNTIYNTGRSDYVGHKAIYIASYGTNKYCYSNLVYNNTVYKHKYGAPIFFSESGSRSSGWEVKDNIFANNLVYHAPEEAIQHPNMCGNYNNCPAYYGLWIDISSSGAWSSFANGNTWHNNLFLINVSGSDQPPATIDDTFGSCVVGYYYGNGGWNKNWWKANNDHPGQFYANIYDKSPAMIDPENQNFMLQSYSPCIDAGEIIDDTNGAFVEANYPGYGWENLSFSGLHPDIGSYEYDPVSSAGDPNGDETPLQIKDYELSQNYPNPFNPSTTIKYNIPVNSRKYEVGSRKTQENESPLPRRGFRPARQSSNFLSAGGGGLINVQLKIYDLLGKEVATLVNGQQRPGIYEVKWDASHMSSGVYFYQLRAGNFIQVRKLILLR